MREDPKDGYFAIVALCFFAGFNRIKVIAEFLGDTMIAGVPLEAAINAGDLVEARVGFEPTNGGFAVRFNPCCR
jgi:hypothetical protein